MLIFFVDTRRWKILAGSHSFSLSDDSSVMGPLCKWIDITIYISSYRSNTTTQPFLQLNRTQAFRTTDRNMCKFIQQKIYNIFTYIVPRPHTIQITFISIHTEHSAGENQRTQKKNFTFHLHHRKNIKLCPYDQHTYQAFFLISAIFVLAACTQKATFIFYKVSCVLSLVLVLLVTIYRTFMYVGNENFPSHIGTMFLPHFLVAVFFFFHIFCIWNDISQNIHTHSLSFFLCWHKKNWTFSLQHNFPDTNSCHSLRNWEFSCVVSKWRKLMGCFSLKDNKNLDVFCDVDFHCFVSDFLHSRIINLAQTSSTVHSVSVSVIR